MPTSGAAGVEPELHDTASADVNDCAGQPRSKTPHAHGASSSRYTRGSVAGSVKVRDTRVPAIPNYYTGIVVLVRC